MRDIGWIILFNSRALQERHKGTCQKLLREGVKKIDFFKEKVLNYGWVVVKSPKLVNM